jgi:6-phosphogluconolactonase
MIRRRSIPLIAAVAGFALFAPLQSLRGAHREDTRTVYFGTYSKKGSQGIYVARFNEKTGALTQLRLAAESSDPSFLALHPSGPYLYAVNEGSAQVSAFSIDAASGKLTLLNQKPTGGDAPCHLALDSTGRMLAVANYTGGSLATFPVGPDGRLGDRKSFIQFAGGGPNSQRQEGPHVHSTTFTADNQFLLVDDLGGDATHVYKVMPQTADITEESVAKSDPGAGPRHVAIAPGGKTVYVLNEIRSTITRYLFAAGTLQKVDTVSTLPPGFHGTNTTAEIAFGAKARYIYASNRGHDSIAVFRVDPGGTISLVQHASTGGHTPRSFAIDSSGKWLLAANQDSDNIVVFHIDSKTGWLKQAGIEIKVGSPVCVLFLPQGR